MPLSAGPKLAIHNDLPVPNARFMVRLPYGWVGYLVFFVELLVIVALSVSSGIAYHELVLDAPSDVEAFFAIGVLTFMYFGGLNAYRGNYTIRRLNLAWRQVQEAGITWVAVCLFTLSIIFLLKVGPELSRGSTVLFFASGLIFVIVWRWCVAKYLGAALAHGSFSEQRIIVIGDRGSLERSTHLDELRRCGYCAVKTLTLNVLNFDQTVQEAARLAREDSKVESIFLALDWQDFRRIDMLTQALRVIALPVRLLPDAKVINVFTQPILEVGQLSVAEIQRGPLTISERAIKRSVDVALSLLLAVMLMPLMIMVAVLIKCLTKGPIFFTQTRAGFNGRPFRILKFRTLSTAEDGSEITQVRRDDERATNIGRLLRKTSIDEFPQLYNVLRGDMSLVGPRPHAAAHNSEYGELIANYAYRHHMKPGLTGWAQVNGFRGETNLGLMQRRVEFDLWYINNWSIWLDFKVLIKTMAVVWRQSSAY